MKQKGFTLVELLIVIAIIGIIAAIAIPNMLMAVQRSRQKGSMMLMHSIATGFESYKGECTEKVFADTVPGISGRYIDVSSAPFLVPMHLAPHPNFDRWGTQFVFLAQDSGDWWVWFSSPGKNTIRESTVNNHGSYQVTQLSDFDNDILFTDGQMTYGPNTTGESS